MWILFDLENTVHIACGLYFSFESYCVHCSRTLGTLTTILCTLSTDLIHPPKYSVHHVRIIPTLENTELTVYEFYAPSKLHYVNSVLLVITLQNTFYMDCTHPSGYPVYIAYGSYAHPKNTVNTEYRLDVFSRIQTILCKGCTHSSIILCTLCPD